MGLHWGREVLDIGWFIILFVVLIHFWRVRKILVQAQSWLKTKGHITSCEWAEAGNSIWPKIEYSYQVYEKDLVGEYLFLDTTLNNPNSKYARLIAYKAVLAYKENSEIDVYYNPNKPEQSALDVSMPVKLNVILILISALTIIHLGFIFLRLLVLYQ